MGQALTLVPPRLLLSVFLQSCSSWSSARELKPAQQVQRPLVQTLYRGGEGVCSAVFQRRDGGVETIKLFMAPEKTKCVPPEMQTIILSSAATPIFRRRACLTLLRAVAYAHSPQRGSLPRATTCHRHTVSVCGFSRVDKGEGGMRGRVCAFWRQQACLQPHESGGSAFRGAISNS